MTDRTSLSGTIAADLRAAIASGELPPGGLLPSERELISRYNTTKSTAGKAIALLQAEGLVTTEFGRGTFVRSQPPLRRVSSSHRHAAHRASGKPIFDTEAATQGQMPSRQILAVGRVVAPTEIAEYLGIPSGQDVVRRKRLQALDGQPAVISTSYYPLWLAAGTPLEAPGALREGPDNLIESLGERFSHGIEVFRARMPTPKESSLLRLQSGVPVVRMVRVDYNREGRALQIADDLYAGDRHEFAFEWSEPDEEGSP